MTAAIATTPAIESTPIERRLEALVELGRSLKDSGYQFTTVTPLTHAYNNERYGQGWARDLRDVFGWARPFLPSLLPSTDFDLMLQAGVVRPYGEGWRSSIRWSSLGENLFVHSGYPTSTTDAVFFGPDTYRFTRVLQQWLASNPASPRRAVDIGCGSGAGAVTLACALPGCAVIATDINPQALQMTGINARLAGVENLTPALSNLLSDVDGQFDLIVANPPYMMDALERAYRHGGGELGAGLSIKIVLQSLKRLQPGGTLLLYTGVAMVNGQDPFLQHVSKILQQAACEWHYEELDPDVFSEELRRPEYASVERIAAVCLRLTLR